MEFPRYWKYAFAEEMDPSGKTLRASCWGWSSSSEAEALAEAERRARKLVQRFIHKDFPVERYPYGARPLREEVLQEIKNSKGETTAIVSRNGYGALILNCAGMMFVDVDLPETPGKGIGGFFSSIFGGKVERPADSPQEQAIAVLKRWLRNNSSWAVRVYKTRAGLRYLMTHQPIDPESSEALQALEALGSDPIYLKLCESQRCFRARLSPKPWRCGLQAPLVRFPFKNDSEQAAFQEWYQTYSKEAENYSTCTLIETLGSGEVHEDIAPLVELHDDKSKVHVDQPLA